MSITVVGVGGAGCRVLSRLPELMPELMPERMPESMPELNGDDAADGISISAGDGGGDGMRSGGGGTRSWAEEGGGGGDVTTLACSSDPDALASSGAQRRLPLPSSAEISISSPQIEAELRRDLEAELYP